MPKGQELAFESLPRWTTAPRLRAAWISGGELERIGLLQQAPQVEVPVCFFQGRYDYSTPGEVVERYFEMLRAPQKTLA